MLATLGAPPQEAKTVKNVSKSAIIVIKDISFFIFIFPFKINRQTLNIISP
jgi:hypothetical protein